MTDKVTYTCKVWTYKCKVCGKQFSSQMHLDNHSFWEHRERWKEADQQENGPPPTPRAKPRAGDDDDDDAPWWVR